MKYICALITVEDMQRAKCFYTDILGQKIKSDYGENIIFESGFSIHNKKHFSKLIGNRKISLNSNSFELYFEHDNLEEIEAKLISENIEFIHYIEVQPWQQKVMRFYDYDKNIIEIGESMVKLCNRLKNNEKSTSEISQITGLPVKEVIDFINSYTN
jgi:hypothetical protein